MQHKVIQIGVVGAMQRAHPALTQLWLQWTGIPGLDHATFDIAKPEFGSNPATQVQMPARKGLTHTWQGFCDLLGLDENAPERRRMPINLPPRSGAHLAFWDALKKREMTEVDGPLEWWWRLMVLRFKSVNLASQILIREVIGDESLLSDGLVNFTNPSLRREGRTAKDLFVADHYEQPTHMTVSVRVKRSAKYEGLAFSLDDASFKSSLVSKLIDLAVARA